MARVINLLKKILFSKTDDVKKKLKESGNLMYPESTLMHQAFVEVLHSEKNRHNVIIGKNCNIMGSLSVYSPDIKIDDDDVMISWDSTIMDTNSHSLISHERSNDVLDWNKGFAYKNWSNVKSEGIHIKKKSWIGFKSIILKGVGLGEGTVVASGSVVTRSFDAYSIIGGNPAKFIKKTNSL